jgi:hypothetical protein
MRARRRLYQGSLKFHRVAGSARGLWLEPGQQFPQGGCRPGSLPGFASCRATYGASRFCKGFAGCRCGQVRKDSVTALHRAFGSPVDPPACRATDVARLSFARAPSAATARFRGLAPGFLFPQGTGCSTGPPALRNGLGGSNPGRRPRERYSGCTWLKDPAREFLARQSVRSSSEMNSAVRSRLNRFLRESVAVALPLALVFRSWLFRLGLPADSSSAMATGQLGIPALKLSSGYRPQGPVTWRGVS